jgi:PAS domain S-box-containing protein
MADNNLNGFVSSSEYSSLTVDKDMNILSFNKRAFDAISESIGIEPRIGDSILLFVLPENNSRAEKNIQKAFNGNYVKEEFIYPGPDNSQTYFEYVFYPIINSNGIINSVSISSIDITEYKYKEKALRESEARYKGIVDSQTDIIIRINLEGKYIFVNNKFCEITGKTQNEILGSDFSDFIHPDEVEIITEAMNKLMKPPFRISGEGRGYTKDGWRWFHFETVAVLNENGDPIEFQAVCSDINEMKSTVNKLIETNELLTAIMHSAPVAIVVFDLTGKISYWSHGAEKMFGWKDEEVFYDNPLITNQDTENFFKRLNSLKEGNLLNLKGLKKYKKDGSVLILDVVGAPLKNESGEIIAVLAVYEDVTTKINSEIENLKLSSVLNLSTGAIAILNKNLEIESINQKFSELTGYTFDDLKGLTLKDIRPPQMPLGEYLAIESKIKSGIEWKNESVNRSKDGNIYYENILVSPIKDNTGAVSNFLLVKEDISERNKALQELINTRLRLGSIMNSLPNLVIFEYSTEFIFLSANIIDVIGYPREAFIEDNGFYKTFIDADDLKKFGNKYREWMASDSKDILSCVMQYKKPTGDFSWLEMYISKINDENGSRICGVIMDITESKQAEEKHIWNEALLHAMTESTRYGYYAVDLITGKILYVNEKFCEMWGISSDYNDILDKKMKNAEVVAGCSKNVRDTNQFYITNMKYSDPDNTITFEDEVELISGRTLKRFSSLLRDKYGESFGRFFLYEDITEKKLYEKISNTQNDYKLLVEEAIDPMVITDIKGEIKVVNSKLCNLTGFNKNELLKSDYFDLFVNPEEKEILVFPEDSLDGQTLIKRKILKRNDGTSVHVEARSKMLPNKLIQTVFGESGKPEPEKKIMVEEGILNIYANILSRLRLFRHGENSLSCLNRISLFLKNLNYMQKPGSGSDVAEIKQRFVILIEEFNSSVGPQLDYIVSLITSLLKDSPNIDYHINMLGLINDVTVFSNRLKKNTMIMYNYIMAEKSSEDISIPKNEILTSVNNIKNAIKSITELLEGSYVTDAEDLLNKIVRKFRESHDNVNISLKVSVNEPRIVFSSLDFQEILNILLVNSTEAADSKKKSMEIYVSLTSSEGKSVIEYYDNGKGIPLRMQERIFDSGVTTKGKNRGFGLNYASRTMKKYGGTITFDSSYGSGVKFILEFNTY